MMFDSIRYWAFFFVVLALVQMLRPARARNVLVIASFAFYAAWDPRLLALLAASTVANYWLGQWLYNAMPEKQKPRLAIGIAFNLVILGFFKYYDFFAGSLAALLGSNPDQWMLHVILPVGISFYTFEGIAYLIDIQRRHLEPRKSLADFALFISFFPHLVAGPIVRPENFFPQVNRGWQLDRDAVRWSYLQIGKGLLKKFVLADSLAPVANAYFNHTGTAGAFAGILAFTLQIYFDFAGYTDIARGCAQLLGFRFPSNFERPYFSANISGFWRNWHISLSSWLRDYLYIPLGGSRVSGLRRYLNYFIVMSLGGLWHGASWNYLIWGMYHGALLMLHRAWNEFGPVSARAFFSTTVGRMGAIALTFAFVMIGWVPFRAAALSDTFLTLESLFVFNRNYFDGLTAAVIVPFIISLLWCGVDRNRQIQDWLVHRASWRAFALGGGMLAWMLDLFWQRGLSIPFIYFQF